MYTTAQFETAVLNLNQDIRLQQISMTNDGRHVRKAWGYKGSKRVEWNSVGIAYLSGERTPSLDLS